MLQRLARNLNMTVSARYVTIIALALNTSFLVLLAPMSGIHLRSMIGSGLMMLTCLLYFGIKKRFLLVLTLMSVMIGFLGVAQHLQAGINICWPLMLSANGLVGLGWLMGAKFLARQ